MQKLLIFNYQKTADLGFSTLEVLVSILVALAFVSFSLQAFVLGVGIKVQAQEKQRANQLIQEDLELISELASIITEDHDNKCNPVATAAAPPIPAKTAYENGYANELWDELQNEKPDGDASLSVKLLKKSDGTELGDTFTLARNHVSNGSSVDPHRTLKINYQVTNSDEDVVAERYVEVIPDVALRCP